MNRPQTTEFPEWANQYIKLVPNDVMATLDRQALLFVEVIERISHKADYAYAPGKWTVKEILGHIIDTERILIYRMLCIARGEKESLPGFDENAYVKQANFANRSLVTLIEEFVLLRKSNIYLIKSLTEEDLERSGVANNKQISVRAIIWVIVGHIIHHGNIIKERYL